MSEKVLKYLYDIKNAIDEIDTFFRCKLNLENYNFTAKSSFPS